MTRLIKSISLVIIFLIVSSGNTFAQTTEAKKNEKPHRNFFTFFIDRVDTQPYSFKKHPLEDLTGVKLSEVYDQPYAYRSKDGLTTVSGVDFPGKNRGAGLMVYPFGSKGNGNAFLVSFSYETLPEIKFTINSPTGIEKYRLMDGKAYNFGLGITSDDRPRGWGLGGHSYAMIGRGKVLGSLGEGKRYFVEGGGGITFGMVGVDMFFRLSRNYLNQPRPHSFYTLPVGVRATVSF